MHGPKVIGLVVRIAPEVGRTVESFTLSATRPGQALGAANLETLNVTTAREGIGEADPLAELDAGTLFEAHLRVSGQPDIPVRLAF